MRKFLLSACLAVGASIAGAQTLPMYISEGTPIADETYATPAPIPTSILDNGSFDETSNAPFQVDTPNSQFATFVPGWDVVTGDGSVFAKTVANGASGPGDPSMVVMDDGQNGGISQTISSDAPFLFVAADIYVQYGAASLGTVDAAGNVNVIGGSDQPGQWVTVYGVVPNSGLLFDGQTAVQVLSADPNGSAFAVDNVRVVPVDSPQ